MRPSQLFSAALLCSSATAWPSFGGSDIGAAFERLILPHKRDAQAITLGSDNANTPNPTQSINTNQATTTASNTRATSVVTSGSRMGTNTASNTGSSSDGSAQTTTNTDTTASATTTDSSSTVIDPRLPPGGISMITPNPRSSTQYYKIGNYITFAWNYTSLSVTPTAIDILATCTANQATYTLAANQTVSGATGAVTWDTNQYQATATVPLLTDTYTLIIHDTASKVTDVAKAGYLGTFMQFTFGMYNGQPYQDMSEEYVCITCSRAGQIRVTGLATVGIVAGLAVVGGTWFVGGIGALL